MLFVLFVLGSHLLLLTSAHMRFIRFKNGLIALGNWREATKRSVRATKRSPCRATREQKAKAAQLKAERRELETIFSRVAYVNRAA
jgi:hypothetical protein